MNLLTGLTPSQIAVIITIVVLSIILIGSIVFLIIWKKQKKTEDKEIPTVDDLSSRIIKACGGKDNITSVSYKMTRLTVGIKTSSLTNVELVKEIKAIVMETKITFVVGSDASNISSNIENLIK